MMRNFVYIVGGIIIIAAMTLAAPYWLKTNRANFVILKQGVPVNDFTFETIDGRRHHLSDFKGNPVMIHFWATWCPPCLVEFPELVAMAKKNPKITVIAVSTDRSKTAMERFLKPLEIPNNFHIVYDGDKSITEGMFATFQLPETVILNKDLTYHDKILGAYTGWSNYKTE